MSLRVVCISDTHMGHEGLVVPDGDVLIHAGDFTNGGSVKEIIRFNSWLGTLPHQHKLVIAGNHDLSLDPCHPRGRYGQAAAAQALLTNCTYMHDTLITIEGYKFYGSPYQPRFYDWAFNLDRGPQLAQKWSQIPSDTDVLITHGPPFGILDRVDRGNVGCADLLVRISDLSLTCHVFGHIHEGYGELVSSGTRFINAACLNPTTYHMNPPILFTLS